MVSQRSGSCEPFTTTRVVTLISFGIEVCVHVSSNKRFMSEPFVTNKTFEWLATHVLLQVIDHTLLGGKN